MDLSSWPEAAKRHFWDLMKKAVLGGRFGWMNVLFEVIPRMCVVLMVGRGGGCVAGVLF
jgi:hypothetical protein